MCSELDCLEEKILAKGLCRKHYKKQYRAANLDKLREQDKLLKRKMRAANPDFQKEYYAANREKCKAYVRKSYNRHRSKRIKEARQWQLDNPDSVRNSVAARRAKEKASQVDKIDRLVVFERDNWVCQLCYSSVDCTVKWPNKGFATLDHIIPNLQLAHYGCNMRKSDSTSTDDYSLEDD